MDNLDVNIMDKSMRSVFVGNIPYEATEEKLKEIFGEVGQVLSFKLVFDRETGKPKGYGFCEYRDPETALSAMRNLNGYEIGGRNLRVDNACTEKSRMEMQSLLNQPPVENPYGDPIQSEKAPEAISKAVASLPPEQMFELMKQMKLCIQNNPSEARNMLMQNPQLAYALLQAQVVMRIVDPISACSMLHQDTATSVPLFPNDKPILGSVQINSNFVPLPVQPPPPVMRPEFPPLQPPLNPLMMNLQAPVFTGQDVDLRSMDMRGPVDPIRGPGDPMRAPGEPIRGPGDPIRGPVDSARGPVELIRGPGDPLRGPGDPNRGPDPRSGVTRINNDQDMRNMPVAPPIQLPNVLPQPLAENFARDPRVGNSPGFDPRQVRLQDPRQKMTPPIAIPTPVPPIRPPPQPPTLPPIQPPMVPPVQRGLPLSPSLPNVGASDQEKAALIMQVLQLSDEQIAMLPPEQRNSILVLKEQIAKSTQR